MKKSIKVILCLLLIIPCIFIFSACSITNGKSAYEIAVENGYDGTVTEWLESLRGNNGSNGTNGIDGTDGTNSLVNIDDIYASAVERGYTGTFFDFLDEYLGNGTLSATQYATAKAIRSVVSVYCTFTISTTSVNIWGQSTTTEQEVASAGSGVIYQINKTTGDAYFITNYHVVYHNNSISKDKISDKIMVLLYGMENMESKITVEFVGGSMNYDIAVLKTTNNDILKNSDAVAVTQANSNDINVGQSAIAIGNPEAEGISVSSGIVSVDSEYITMTGVDEKTNVTFRVMRVDTAINSGNSGGGLFDNRGNLIGIVNAKIIDDSIENIGYAIPSNIAIGVAQNIIDANKEDSNTHTIKKCIIGLSLTVSSSSAVWNEDEQSTNIIENIAVDSVTSGSLADGKFEEYDIIKSVVIDETTTTVTRLFHAIDMGLSYRVGDNVKFNIMRDGVPMQVSITFTSENTQFVS